MRSATNSCSPGKSKVRISPIDSNTKVSWLLQFLLSLNLEFAFVLAIVTFSIERRAAYHRTADILLVPGGTELYFVGQLRKRRTSPCGSR